MSRRSKSVKRTILPDPVHNSTTITQFVNKVLWCGKKTVAQRIMYEALTMILDKTKEDGYTVFQRGMKNVKPVLEVRPRRVGGATYQIPMEVSAERRETLAIKWIIAAARARTEHTMAERLANEFIDASKNQGAAIKKKEDTHKMAEANRAFAHYRW
jgi:small subunit ribosomal protein S7